MPLIPGPDEGRRALHRIRPSRGAALLRGQVEIVRIDLSAVIGYDARHSDRAACKLLPRWRSPS